MRISDWSSDVCSSDLKLSLDALAAAAGMSKSYLWELENNDDANPTMEKLASIAAVLNVTPEFLAHNELADQPEDAFDKAFFRNYKTLKPETKDQKSTRLNSSH